MRESKNNIYWLIFGAALIVLAALYLFFRNKEEAPPRAPEIAIEIATTTPPLSLPPETTEGTKKEVPDPVVSGQLQIIQLVIAPGGFEPAIINLQVGERLQLNISARTVGSDIYIPYWDYYETISPGETKYFFLDGLKEAEYEFLCRDRCPAGKVIRGKIVVLPK